MRFLTLALIGAAGLFAASSAAVGQVPVEKPSRRPLRPANAAWAVSAT